MLLAAAEQRPQSPQTGSVQCEIAEDRTAQLQLPIVELVKDAFKFIRLRETVAKPDSDVLPIASCRIGRVALGEVAAQGGPGKRALAETAVDFYMATIRTYDAAEQLIAADQPQLVLVLFAFRVAKFLYHFHDAQVVEVNGSARRRARLARYAAETNCAERTSGS